MEDHFLEDQREKQTIAMTFEGAPEIPDIKASHKLVNRDWLVAQIKDLEGQTDTPNPMHPNDRNYAEGKLYAYQRVLDMMDYMQPKKKRNFWTSWFKQDTLDNF